MSPSEPPTPNNEPDPELEALPVPRRPGRVLTLVALSLTVTLSLFMASELFGASRYALSSGPPRDLGDAREAELGEHLNNQWVRAQAILSSEGAVRYGRPLDRDGYRLARVEGRDDLWVQLRVPEGMGGPRFVPPSSIVGRLVAFDSAGLRYRALGKLARPSASSGRAWVLVDGEAPGTDRWAVGLVGLFVSFAAFGIYGLWRLSRPIRDD